MNSNRSECGQPGQSNIIMNTLYNVISRHAISVINLDSGKSVMSENVVFCFVLMAVGTMMRMESPASPSSIQSGPELVKLSGIRGGVVVHLGCGDAALTETLRVGNGFIVRGLDTDKSKVKTARKRLLSSGNYGPVAIDVWKCGDP